MSSWACSKCTYINSPSQKSHCEICFSPQPKTLPSSPSKPKWSCTVCTFLNPYGNSVCEICSTRASAFLLSTIEVNDDDLQEAQLGSSVFLPLRSFSNIDKGNSEGSAVSAVETGSFGLVKDGVLSLDRWENGNFGIRRSPFVGSAENREGDSGAQKGFSVGLRPCSNKRKEREDLNGDDGGNDDGGGFSGFRTDKAGNKAVEAKSVAAGASHLGSGSDSKTWKILTYNIWFQTLEMHERMKALGHLIALHSPDVICLQEVTANIYHIFKQSSWWKGYGCSITDKRADEAPYFCMQLCKLPVKSYSSRPFQNSIMGRELCVAEVELHPDTALVVATSHLESPSPEPPTWDQMLSKERVHQANEAVNFLKKNRNVIFCGDMNWDDKLDGPFPLLDGWVDAWTELRPGEPGWTYDTKSNKMLSANRTLQKRLDRFICKLNDFKTVEIQMIGQDEIPGLTYIKEKKVKGQVKELPLPVLPSDHYGLLLTISPNDSV